MPYYGNVKFDSVQAALEYVQAELQKTVDQNNAIILDIEKTTASTELLKTQHDTLLAKTQYLSAEVTQLEKKRETIKREVKDHVAKTTARLEKERSDFENVRIKERNRLVTLESDLNTREQTLDQRELAQNESDKDLKGREDAIGLKIAQVATEEQQILKREAEVNAKDIELSKKALELNTRESDIANRELQIENRNTQSDQRQQQVEDIVKLAEERMAKIETIGKQQEQRDSLLNTREAKLKELDKILTAKKIQLDDRSATDATH